MEDKEFKDYQVISIEEKVHYEWKSGIFKKNAKTGSFTYKPRYIVAKSYDEAIKIYENRFIKDNIGKVEGFKLIDKEYGIGSFYVKNPTIINVEFICKTPKFSIEEMKNNLGFNDFMKIFTYYKIGYEKIFTE